MSSALSFSSSISSGKRVGGFSVELEADHGPDSFRLPARLQMSVQDKPVSRIKSPGKSIGFLVGRTARLPKQELTFRIQRIAIESGFHTRKAAALCGFQTSSKVGPIHKQVCVMDDVRGNARLDI
jgi:hypothetical protein